MQTTHESGGSTANSLVNRTFCYATSVSTSSTVGGIDEVAAFVGVGVGVGRVHGTVQEILLGPTARCRNAPSIVFKDIVALQPDANSMALCLHPQ